MACHSERSEESKRIRLILKTLSLVALLLILQSCSNKAIDKEAPAINEVKAGEKFLIILPENHDEGLLWKLSDKHNNSVAENMGAVWHGNEKGIYFRFVAGKTGTDTLSFTQYKTDTVTKERDSVKSATYIIKITE